MKALIVLVTVTALGACASENIRVRCDARLELINSPAPAVRDLPKVISAPVTSNASSSTEPSP